ncbi:complex I subunit 5 family protein [Deefgea rivuli]|uniref:complex I subunit 5 family protein n=1 Tax=Deefgea rivuli TaxID=400948 RepID=UPI000683E1E0|nr:proton-conducting transporter membrane subunit [Deefgea rivuli]
MLNYLPEASSSGNLLLVFALTLPFIGMMLAFAIGGKQAQRIAIGSILIGVGLNTGIVYTLIQSGQALSYQLGAWAPPLGIALHVDGLSAAMLLITAIILFAVSIFASADFQTPIEQAEARAPLMFWTLLLGVWGALNLLFLASDLFTLYVALELLTFAGVPLVCLDGKAETLQAALRYLLFALLGSVLYLLGAVILYGAYGTLDIALLAQAIRPEPAAFAAAALMTVGLLAKTALFPLHLWLPPAHAGAPAGASAVLSALVVKGSFFLLLRLWLDVMPNIITPAAGQLLAGLGASAIIIGNIVALRQTRLKLLIAYSTVAQIGYLFLMFPLAAGLTAMHLPSAAAEIGGMLQVISHATAKAAMFMAAGLIYTTLGHDRIADLRGVGRQLPMTMLAFALAGASLIGLPPTGGFLAKWLLLTAALTTGQWWWGAVMLIGGLLTSTYVFIVLAKAMLFTEAPLAPKIAVPRYREAAVLALASIAFLLGLAAFSPVDILQIGRPFTMVQP